MDNNKINQNILRKKTLLELHKMLKCKIITISTTQLKSYNSYLQYIPNSTLPQSELNLDDSDDDTDNDMPPLESN
jgi:hypothetical protein